MILSEITSQTCLFSVYINVRPSTEVFLWFGGDNEDSFSQKIIFYTIKKLFKVLPIFELFGVL